MGVWHLSGLGLYPGAVTVPLTYIYLALKCASKGVEEAKTLFDLSGERTQQLKGVPESIIIFTSEEVITGKKDGREWNVWQQSNVTDNWFQTKKRKNIPYTIANYLRKLLQNLKDEDFSEFYGGKWLKDIYFVSVNHEDFDDCYLKIGTTVCALEKKEVWVNMIGGTNQINLSLLVTGSFFAVPSIYYYIFQSKTDLLHPEMNKPNLKNPMDFLHIFREKWHEIPIFQLATGDLINELSKKFENRGVINIKDVEHLLEQNGYPKQYIAKLRGRMIDIKGERVSKGYLLGKMKSMIEKIEEQDVNSVSDWIKWCKNEEILWKCNLEGNLERVK